MKHSSLKLGLGNARVSSCNTIGRSINSKFEGSNPKGQNTREGNKTLKVYSLRLTSSMGSSVTYNSMLSGFFVIIDTLAQGILKGEVSLYC
jgi:hypothetical protein